MAGAGVTFFTGVVAVVVGLVVDGLVVDGTFDVVHVDDNHADVTLPRCCKSGDYLDIQHGEGTKTIKVPSGTKGGDEFTVRFIQNQADEIEPTTSAFCCL